MHSSYTVVWLLPSAIRVALCISSPCLGDLGQNAKHGPTRRAPAVAKPSDIGDVQEHVSNASDAGIVRDKTVAVPFHHIRPRVPWRRVDGICIGPMEVPVIAKHLLQLFRGAQHCLEVAGQPVQLRHRPSASFPIVLLLAPGGRTLQFLHFNLLGFAFACAAASSKCLCRFLLGVELPLDLLQCPHAFWRHHLTAGGG